MARTIDFSIPFVGDGIRYLEYLISNALRTAADPARIRFIVSYHTDDDFNVLQQSPVYKKISQTVMAPVCPAGIMFRASANHAAAINALAITASADIVIFSDYDMAFVYPGWDNLIERYFFANELALCGVTYPPLWIQITNPKLEEMVPALKGTELIKYQQLPNLSFFCVKGGVLATTFSSRLTHYDDYLSSGGLPFRLINTPELAAANNLPLGALQWLDTGHELPGLIRQMNIPYTIFPYRMLDQQTVLKNVTNYELLPSIFRPEVFYCQPENVPFLCHFKKGTLKSESDDIEYAFNRFVEDIEAFLKQLT